MEYDDKTLALAKYLKCDPALIENNYGDYFTVNGRTIKDGKTPEQFKKLADDFRALLSEEMQELVTDAIVNPTKKVKVQVKSVEKRAGLNNVVKTEEKEVELCEHAYSEVSKFLEPMKEKAAKRVEQLKRIHAGEWKPPIKETPEDIYARLEKDNLYVVNILYHLIKDRGDRYNNGEYSDSLRRGWLGQPISDTRKDRTVDDGEYRVLTDDEADDAVRESLDDLFDQIVEVPAHLTEYVDKEKWIDDNSGDRGETLNGYDGTEEEVEFEGTTYYLYRNN